MSCLNELRTPEAIRLTALKKQSPSQAVRKHLPFGTSQACGESLTAKYINTSL